LPRTPATSAHGADEDKRKIKRSLLPEADSSDNSTTKPGLSAASP